MLAWGLAGLVNLGLAGFFALGAYASAMSTTWAHVPIPGGIALGVAVGGGVGLVVCGSPRRRPAA